MLYACQLDLAEQNATSQMLFESFAGHGYTGSTLRKAIVFYLSLVEYLGLPNSPHFRAPKQSATPTAKRRFRLSRVSKSSERSGLHLSRFLKLAVARPPSSISITLPSSRSSLTPNG